MTIINPLVPEGISHAQDLPDLSRAELAKHHRSRLRAVFLQQGTDGVAEYKRQHPEAASIRIKSDVVAYSPKPSGYVDHLASLVGSWLTDDTALRASNVADVAELTAASLPTGLTRPTTSPSRSQRATWRASAECSPRET